MKRLLFALGLLLTPHCLAQQPDLRLRLLSLYKIQRAAIHSSDATRMRWCSKCDATRGRQTVHISALGSRVRDDDDGRIADTLWIDGAARAEFQLQFDAAPPRTLRMPVEVHANSGELLFIERLTMEEYTAAVVQGETAGNMPPEALRAMAVAARTYATRFRERHKAEHFDFCDSTHCQFVNAEVAPAVAAAVEQTRGELLWERGKPIAAYYHQDCGGKSEAASEVWPEAARTESGAHDDPYCVRVSKPWRAEISRHDLQAALLRSGLRVPPHWTQLRVVERTPSGRAHALLLEDGSSGNGLPLAASSLRFAVGRAMGWALLKSDLYDVAEEGDHFVFSGRGSGHGVGLCQLGTAEMAREGKGYREILAFYYPGAAIGVAASGIVWRKSPAARLDVFTVDDGSAAVLKAAERALAWAESQTHTQATLRPAIYVYPSVEIFRNATGEPGWVAASTRGSTIRMQPAAVLGARVEPVLRHELLHLLLEANTAPQTPLWFREGLAMLLGGDAPTSASPLTPQRMEEALREHGGYRGDYKATQAAYASSLDTVARLEQQYGRNALLGWLRTGLPTAVLDGEGRAQEAAHQR